MTRQEGSSAAARVVLALPRHETDVDLLAKALVALVEQQLKAPAAEDDGGQS